MAAEQDDIGNKPANEPHSAARALEAARMEMPRSSVAPTVVPTARPETASGPRYAVRTMQRDVEAALKREKPSLGTVVIAEERRRRERALGGEGSDLSRIEPLLEASHSRTAKLAVIGGTVLLLGAVVTTGFLVLAPSATPIPTIGSGSHTTIPVDGSLSPVTLSGLTTLAIRARLREAVQKANTPVNTVYAIPLVDRGQLLPEEKGAILVELTTDEFFRRVAPERPAALRRALDPSFTFGVHAFNGDSAFLAFGVQSFEIAFAEMFAWERTLSLDLGPVFRSNRQEPSRVPEPTISSDMTEKGGSGAASSTSGAVSSTTETFVPRRTLRSGAQRFEDEVVKNYDTRVLRDERGAPFLLYTFPNRSTLFIAGSTVTLEELIERITTLKRE